MPWSVYPRVSELHLRSALTADSYDKRATGWNTFNLQPLQRKASQASVILCRQAVREKTRLEVTGGGGEFCSTSELTSRKLITRVSTWITSLNNCEGEEISCICPFSFLFFVYVSVGFCNALAWCSYWIAISSDSEDLNFYFSVVQQSNIHTSATKTTASFKQNSSTFQVTIHKCWNVVGPFWKPKVTELMQEYMNPVFPPSLRHPRMACCQRN